MCSYVEMHQHGNVSKICFAQQGMRTVNETLGMYNQTNICHTHTHTHTHLHTHTLAVQMLKDKRLDLSKTERIAVSCVFLEPLQKTSQAVMNRNAMFGLI